MKSTLLGAIGDCLSAHRTVVVAKGTLTSPNSNVFWDLYTISGDIQQPDVQRQLCQDLHRGLILIVR